MLVTFAAEKDRVWMCVEDDGCGFDAGGRPRAPDEGHLGLGIMRERAEELGGSLRVESEPGAGTRVVAEVPRREV